MPTAPEVAVCVLNEVVCVRSDVPGAAVHRARSPPSRTRCVASSVLAPHGVAVAAMRCCIVTCAAAMRLPTLTLHPREVERRAESENSARKCAT